VTSPILALRAAILEALAADAALIALMGGSLRLYDEPPRAAEPVYAVFEEASARDASVDGADRREHAVRIAVWGRSGAASPALEAAERIAGTLDDAPLVLAGHHLVRLRVSAVEAGRDPRGRLARVVVALDGTTEDIRTEQP
jgi:hypothetical protein